MTAILRYRRISERIMGKDRTGWERTSGMSKAARSIFDILPTRYPMKTHNKTTCHHWPPIQSFPSSPSPLCNDTKTAGERTHPSFPHLRTLNIQLSKASEPPIWVARLYVILDDGELMSIRPAARRPGSIRKLHYYGQLLLGSTTNSTSILRLERWGTDVP